MAESWPTFVYNWNESLWYSMKVFLVINFQFHLGLSHLWPKSFASQLYCSYLLCGMLQQMLPGLVDTGRMGSILSTEVSFMKQVRWSSWVRSRHGVCMQEWSSILQLIVPSKNEGVGQSYFFRKGCVILKIDVPMSHSKVCRYHIDIESPKIDCLSFVYVPATSAAHYRLLFCFFLLRPFTVQLSSLLFLDVFGLAKP